MTFRVGLVGSGNISETHARAATAAAGVEIVGHWSRNAPAAQRQASAHGGRAYATLEEMLADADLDAVIIGTPATTHADLARVAVRHGVHALVEKPLDVATARIDELLAEADRAGIVVGVCFQD
nr:Gfo/Idh/MocA family oxidoreductase [Gemmatimonadaceae bacterium]